MEHINIISKEAITKIADWLGYTIFAICIAAILSAIVYLIIVKDHDKFFRYLVWTGIGAIVFEFIAFCICSAFFRVPTGRYRYEATIDKDKITVSEYEAFIEEYNPTIKDGIYYWEDKAE